LQVRLDVIARDAFEQRADATHRVAAGLDEQTREQHAAANFGESVFDGSDRPRILHPLQHRRRKHGFARVPGAKIRQAALERLTQARRVEVVMHYEERDIGVRVVEQCKKQVLYGHLVVPCVYALNDGRLECSGADAREPFDDGFGFDEHTHGARIVHRIVSVGSTRRIVRVRR
jgi:hypothetical protein